MRDVGSFEETRDGEMVYEYTLEYIASKRNELLEWAKGVNA